jgi:hypothetical protein
MSTRSQLRFIRPDQDDASPEKPSGVAQVYKHSDGYPSAVVHLLVELADLLHATDTLRGPTYAAAQFIFLDTCSVMPLYLPSDAEPDESRTIDAASPRDAVDPSQMRELDQPLFLLGNAVEDPATGIHGDEEFLYEIEVPPGPSAALEDWSVRVSAHCGFPRWNGQTALAFDRATWQFRGSLPDAHLEFVQDGSDDTTEA